MTESVNGASAAAEALLTEATDAFVEQLDRGEKPDVEEFVQRYPAVADALRHVLPALRLLRVPDSIAASDTEPTLGCLGDFRILHEIGRGGMGIVFEAEQISLKRRVALKMPPFAATLDPKQLRRFKNEAQAAAQLHHTNIVPVYSVGCERGLHYYAMQYIEGRTLAALIENLRHGPAESPQPTAPHPPPTSAASTLTVGQARTERTVTDPTFYRTAAQLGIQAAEALDHAHQVGIIHRDIKPANLLIEGEPGPAAAGVRLWVTDFGLAQVQGDPKLTLTGDVVGTLRYMSPEQALGNRALVDHRTDVYSLGVTLYELLALQPAFGGNDRQELLRQIASEEPKPPRRINAAIPAELETIVLKAMEKHPEERYATAQALADDLRCFLEDKPIRAKRPTFWQRTRKWARRHKAVATTAGIAAALFLLTTTGVLAATNLMIAGEQEETAKALKERTEALESVQAEQTKTQLALQEEQHVSYFHRIALADSEWRTGNVELAEQLLDECPLELRGWEWHYLTRLCHSDLLTIRGHTNDVLQVAFSTDGKRIFSFAKDWTVRVWDLVERKQVNRFGPGGTRAIFSPDGRLCAAVGSQRIIRVWDTSRAREVATLRPPGEVGGLAFRPDGQQLALAMNGAVSLWSLPAGKEVLQIAVPDARLEQTIQLAFSADGKQLVLAGGGALQVIDATAGQLVHRIHGLRGQVDCVVFAPNGQNMATASLMGGHLWMPGVDQGNSEVKVWDLRAGQELFTLHGHTGPVYGLVFSPDGGRIVTASGDKTVKVWDAQTGRELWTLRGHRSSVLCVAVSSDGKHIASGSGGAKVYQQNAKGELTPMAEYFYQPDEVKVWDATTGQEALTLADEPPNHASQVTDLAISRDGKHLVIANMHWPVKIIDARTGKLIRRLAGHTHVHNVAFSPDSRYLATASRPIHLSEVSGKTEVKLWDTESWSQLLTLPDLGDSDLIYELAFSPDGNRLATAGGKDAPNRTGEVIIWEIPTGRKILSFCGHSAWVFGLAFSPNGQQIVSGDGSTVKIWDAATGEERVTIPYRGFRVAFSPDGLQVVTAGNEGTLKVWDAGTGKELLALRGHTAYVQGVAFSPQSTNRRIVSAGYDGMVKLWDARTGREILSLRAHTDGVTRVCLSPDGNKLSSAGGRGPAEVKIWNGDPLDAVHQHPAQLLDGSSANREPLRKP